MLYTCELTGPTFVPRIHASRKAKRSIISRTLHIFPLLSEALLMNQYNTLDPVSLVGSVQYMFCVVDKSLSVFMTLKMCLRGLCRRFVIFYCLNLNHLVRVFYLFMFSYWRRLEFAFYFFHVQICRFRFLYHLQITDIYNTRKSTVLAFRLETNSVKSFSR